MIPSTNQLQNLLRERDFQRQALILIISTIIFMIIVFLFGRINFWDDAYITFRYARNLAEGHGITWNISDPPTQGATTFAFVPLIAMGFKLGVPVELMAFILNSIGMLFIVLTLHFTYRLIFDDKSLLAILPSFVTLTYSGTLELVASGMESVFWTGMVYITLLILMFYREQRREWILILFFILSYLTCLTRPESALIVGLWFLYLISFTVGKQRLYTFAGIIIFGIVGLIYVAWLNSYFGHVFPNAFYIKVNSGLNQEGVHYVLSFIVFFLIKPIVIVSLMGLFFLFRDKGFSLLPHFVFFLLLPVYLFTQPLTGVAFRFVHPVSILILFLYAMGGLYHFRIIWEKIQQSDTSFVLKNRAFLSGLCVFLAIGFFFFSFFNYSVGYYRNMIIGVVSGTQQRISDAPSWQAAHLLANVPDVENSTIIYGDAGIISYATSAYHIDPVGLNHTSIAQDAQERGGEWVVDLLMEYDADLIVFYSQQDGQIPELVHGVIGPYFSNLYLHPEFQNNYVEIAAIDYSFVISRWFARINSPYRENFKNALEPISMENPPPITP